MFIGLPGYKSKIQQGPCSVTCQSASLEQQPRVRTLQGQWVRVSTELSHFRLSELYSLGARGRGEKDIGLHSSTALTRFPHS